jgi:phenylalanyl-tRNA synthetase beta chain
VRAGRRRAAAGEGGASEPFRIEVGKIRGVESRGMLCSARELKLSDDHEGLLALDDSAKVGADVREALRLDDTIFTLKLTPNLGHALSVHGVAREVAAITGAPLKSPTFAKAPVGSDRKLPVAIEAPTCAGASPAASSPASTPRRRRRSGWPTAWRAAASARSRRWSTSRTT